MPYARADAPPGLPDSETIEALLGKRNTNGARTHTKKTLAGLNDEERRQTGLITLGKRHTKIPGDPYGVYLSWAGNVAHPKDDRMFGIMEPIFEELMNSTVTDSPLLQSLGDLLKKIPTTDLELLANAATGGRYTLVKKTTEETIVEFELGAKRVRLMQAHDIDKNVPATYDKASRCHQAKKRVELAFNEPEMPISVQQYLMASLLQDGAAVVPTGNDEEFFEDLRSTAREKFWLLMSKDERTHCRATHADTGPQLDDFLSIVKSNWQSRWNGGAYDKDFFRNYLEDRIAAEEDAWELVDVDVFVVTDRNRQTVFANVVGLMQLLYGEATVRLLTRCLDNWSFFVPLPLPETRRHVIDKHIRRIHPELDPAKATVEQLPHAKMAVAHYGCWSGQYDPKGNRVFRTMDAVFSRSQDQSMCRSLFPQFCKAALGKATSVIRFLVKPLDPEHYADCVEILKNLPPDEKIQTDEEDFMSLFAMGVNGYTQRHKDINDISGGMAGLFTLGRYTGADLCVPQLGVRVRYTPGSCAILRGDKLNHLVQDYTGPRFFIIGTNHKSVARYAWRKMGRAEKTAGTTEVYSETPCVNYREDDDDDDIVWTNSRIHGPGALAPDSRSST